MKFLRIFLMIATIISILGCPQATMNNPSVEDDNDTGDAEIIVGDVILVPIYETISSVSSQILLSVQGSSSGKLLGYKVKAKDNSISGNIEIPYEYDNKPIVEIVDNGFSDCEAVTNIEIPHTVKEIGTEAFSGCKEITSVKIPSSVSTVASKIFSGCDKLTNTTITQIDTSSGWSTDWNQNDAGETVSTTEYILTPMKAILSDTTLTVSKDPTSTTGLKGAIHAVVTDDNRKTITNIVIEVPDGEKIIPETDLSYLFSDSNYDTYVNYDALTSIDGLDKIDMSGVWDFFSMFRNCISLETLDLSDWDTSSLKTVNMMFRNCSSLESANFEGWNTRKVDNLHMAFDGCSALQSLDLSDWDTSNVWYMPYLFNQCNSLEYLDLSGWDTTNVWDGQENNNSIFSGCDNLSQAGIITKNAKIGSILQGHINNLPKNFPTKMSATLSNDGKVLTVTPTVGGKTLKAAIHAVVTDDNRARITKVILTAPTIGKIIPETDLTSLFADTDYTNPVNYDQLTEISGLGNIDTSNVNTMMEMFNSCSSLNSLDLSAWDTSNVTKMNYMFCGCASLTTLNISNWNSSNVTATSSWNKDGSEELFSGCAKLIKTAVTITGATLSDVVKAKINALPDTLPSK